MPHSPCFDHLRGDPISTAESFLINAKRTLSSISVGNGLPCNSLSLGFGFKQIQLRRRASLQEKKYNSWLWGEMGRFVASGLLALRHADANNAIFRRKQRTECRHPKSACRGSQKVASELFNFVLSIRLVWFYSRVMNSSRFNQDPRRRDPCGNFLSTNVLNLGLTPQAFGHLPDVLSYH